MCIKNGQTLNDLEISILRSYLWLILILFLWLILILSQLLIHFQSINTTFLTKTLETILITLTFIINSYNLFKSTIFFLRIKRVTGKIDWFVTLLFAISFTLTLNTSNFNFFLVF